VWDLVQHVKDGRLHSVHHGTDEKDRLYVNDLFNYLMTTHPLLFRYLVLHSLLRYYNQHVCSLDEHMDPDAWNCLEEATLFDRIYSDLWEAGFEEECKMWDQYEWRMPVIEVD